MKSTTVFEADRSGFESLWGNKKNVNVGMSGAGLSQRSHKPSQLVWVAVVRIHLPIHSPMV